MGGASYHRPKTLKEASKLLKGKGSVAIAGGTDVMPLLNRRLLRPKSLVDLTGLPSLKGVSKTKQRLVVGSLATMTELESHPLVQKHGVALAEAASALGSPLVRNLATVGGNVCNASPAMDTAPPLIVLGAKAVIQGPKARRSISIGEFFKGVNETALKPGDILTRLEFPTHGAGTGSAFYKLMKRRTLNLAVVNAAAFIEVKRKKITGVKLALGAVAPTPIRVPDIEAALLGQYAEEALSDLRETSALASEAARPITDVRASKEYRNEMVNVAAERALAAAINRALGVDE